MKYGGNSSINKTIFDGDGLLMLLDNIVVNQFFFVFVY